MGDIARLGEKNEATLYAAMGINAELLIDHSWDWEPTTMKEIADSVGLINMTYLYKLFKEVYGCTPQEYRIQSQNKV